LNRKSLCQKHLAELLGTTGKPPPERLSDKIDLEEREKQHERAMDACNKHISINKTNVQQGRSYRRSLTAHWEWLMSIGHKGDRINTIPSLPGLSPSTTTPGMPESIPTTPRQSSDNACARGIQVASSPVTMRPRSTDSPLLSREQDNITKPALKSACILSPSQSLEAQQNDSAESAAPLKPEIFTDPIDFIKWRCSIVRDSVASALTIGGSRTSRWSKRVSHRSQENIVWFGCHNCSRPARNLPNCDNIADYLHSNGPYKAEDVLLTELSAKVYRGSDVNGRTSEGETALHIATGGGFQSICRSLLDHAADVYAVTNHDETIGSYGKCYSRATKDNVQRYARITWCLCEVKRHKMYRQPSLLKKGKHSVPMHFRNNISPLRPKSSVKARKNSTVAHGQSQHAVDSPTSCTSPHNTNVSRSDNGGMGWGTIRHSVPPAQYFPDPQQPTQSFAQSWVANSGTNFGVQLPSPFNHPVMEIVPWPLAQAQSPDSCNTSPPAASQPGSFIEPQLSQQYQFPGVSQIPPFLTSGWSQSRHTTQRDNTAMSSNVIHRYPMLQQPQNFGSGPNTVMAMEPPYLLLPIPQTSCWSPAAVSDTSFFPEPGTAWRPPSTAPLTPPGMFHSDVEFNPDCAPMLPYGVPSLAELLAYTKEPWQNSGIGSDRFGSS
jgi:hypothetical protein